MTPTISTTVRYQHRSISTLATAGRSTLALVLALLALANLVDSLVIKPWSAATFGEQVIDLDSLGFTRAETVLLAALLLLVARALAHGKRQAWWLSLCIVGLAVLGALPGHARAHAPHLLVMLALVLVALLALAPLFARRSDPRALRRGYLALAVSLCCLVLLRQVHQVWHPGLVPGWRLLRQITLDLLRGGVLVTVTYGVAAVLRPVRAARHLTQDERERALAVVRRYGMVSTAYFAAGDDKRFFWSESGRALVAYRLIRGVALVLGDPVGPEEEREAVLLAFASYCRQQDWTAAWYLASPPVRAWCRQWGMAAYQVGEEAVVEIDRFTTAGKVGAPVRHAVTRARKGGVQIRCWHGEDLPAGVFAGMKRVSRTWQEAHDATIQRGFSMGRFPADWSRELLTVVACDQAGEVQAFLTWTPLYQGGGWSLDVMRRAGEATPGTMEWLIAESIGWARHHGQRRMSLGLAPLAGLGAAPEGSTRDLEQETHSPLERLAGRLHQRQLFLANYATLSRFKAKFQPTWEPRYLLVEDGRALPQALAALMQAMGYSWKSVVREALSGLRPPHRGQDAR
jgi:phosphatidylglycerol lysyltransferase